MKAIALAATIGAATMFYFSAQSADAGCLKGAIIGGIAGHYAGNHGLLGAGAGCFIGNELANRPARRSTMATRDQYGRPVARDQYGNLVRSRD